MPRYKRKPHLLDDSATLVPVHSARDWGRCLRGHRDASGLRLEDVSDVTLLGMRFLSELERGKPGASLEKAIQAANALGLEVLIAPREQAAALRHHLRREHGSATGSCERSDGDTPG